MKVKLEIFRKLILPLLVLLPLLLAMVVYLFYFRVTNGGLSHTNPLHIPEILIPVEEGEYKVFDITLQHGRQEFLPGLEAETMGYNGNYLGPTIRVNTGDNVRFNVYNELNEVSTVHWHGMHVPPEMDGTPHQPIEPGGSWHPFYPIKNEASTMWYHPHTHEGTADQVFLGLAGLFIIDDENSNSLPLPNTYGVDDIPLIIQDRRFDEDGELDYQIAGGMFQGDEILVNGTYNPHVRVSGTQIRFRILNGSNARIYNFGFSDDREFFQIATDGGLLERPVALTRLLLSPGERAEIVVDFSDDTDVYFKSYPHVGLGEMFEDVFADGAGNGHFDLLKIIVEPTEETPLELPAVLNVIEGWRAADADRVRPIQLAGPVADGQAGGRQGGGIPINGRTMDMGRVDEVVVLDDVEIWEITNAGGQAHPFHIHDIQFLILDRDGQPAAANERGWKDTALVSPGETVRFITQFTTYADAHVPFMYHCHIMEHEDNGMMGQFTVVEPDSEYADLEEYMLDVHH